MGSHFPIDNNLEQLHCSHHEHIQNATRSWLGSVRMHSHVTNATLSKPSQGFVAFKWCLDRVELEAACAPMRE